MKVIKPFKYSENGTTVINIDIGDTDLSDRAIEIGLANGSIQKAKQQPKNKSKRPPKNK